VFSSAHPFFDPFESCIYTTNTTLMPRHGTSLSHVELDNWLVRWDGEGALQRWHVSGLDFSQYIHEALATRSFLVWMDSAAYVWEPGERQGLPRTYPQKPYTDLAIVRKRDLTPGVRDVEARFVRIPLESAHIFADYEDDGEHLTLYCAHANSMELTLTVRPGDINHFTGQPVSPEVIGRYTIADVNPFGRYVIHVDCGEIESSAQVLDRENLWGLSLYSRDLRRRALRHNRTAYLGYAGFDPAALTRRMVELYGPHPHRLVPVDSLPRAPKPSCLVRVDLERMVVEDGYTLGPGRFAFSPTWFPDSDGGEGWLQALVWDAQGTEVWLFRADRLSAGPVARLGAEGFRLPGTIHTTWMPELRPRRSAYHVDFAQDIGPHYQRLPTPVREAVERVMAARRR
jgi:hypothetical protein